MTPSQTFHDHISELRRRLAWVVVAVGVCAAIGYVFRIQIIRFLQHPLGAPLFYSSPAGSFNFMIKVATMTGIVLALPLIIYQLIRFLEPAMPARVRASLIAKVIFFSWLLAAIGMAFGFFVIIPTSLHFFSGFSDATIKPLISADSYLSFVLNVLVTFALLFQIPLVVLFINQIKRIRPKQLLRYQRHIVVGAFVLAVILPFTYDPLTQFVMAIPIIFLYYLSIILVWLANRHAVYGDELPTDAVMIKTEPEQSELEPVAVTTMQPPAHPEVAWEQPVTVAPVAPVLAAPPALAVPRPRRKQINAWQAPHGGLKSSKVLKTAVDVVKPGTISRSPLKLDALNAVKPNRYNILDLSQQS